MAAGHGRGVRVTRTGIALVHEGELVMPAADSAAHAEQMLDDERSEIQYHFPVEIEVRSGEAAVDVDALIERALGRLVQGLEGA
ncbi:hypothetical protein [Nocardia xishanensis]